MPHLMKGQLRRISPEEISWGLINRLGAGIANEEFDVETLKKWFIALRSWPFEFHVVEKEEDFFWMATDQRELIGKNYMTLYRTTLERIYELCTFRDAEARKTSQPPMKAEVLRQLYHSKLHNLSNDMKDELTVTFVDTAIYVWEHVLVHSEINAMVANLERRFGRGGPLDSVYKLEALGRKTGSGSGKKNACSKLAFIIRHMEDMIENGVSSPADFTVSLLLGKGRSSNNKGILDLIMYKQDMLAYFTGEFLQTTFKDRNVGGKVSTQNPGVRPWERALTCKQSLGGTR